MKMKSIAVGAVTIMTGVAAPAQPTPAEVHQKVFDTVKAVRDVLVPQPVVQFVETFPPIAIPRQKILQLAQATPPPPEPPIAPGGDAVAEWANDVAMVTKDRVMGGIFGAKPRSPLIVSSSDRDPKSTAQIEEDLNVMMRILEKSANTRDEAKAMGIDLFSLGGGGNPKVFYLEGYGAMFLLRVKYPLLPPPSRDEASRTNESTNSEWERARQEVYGNRRPFEERFLSRDGAAEEFDADRVEKLKGQIIDDLVNATHIRSLKGDDFVSVVVSGASTRPAVVRHEARAWSGGGGGYGGGGVVRSPADSAQSTMTLRVRKSDVDAFAKGKMKSEEFRKKVSVQVY